MNHSKELKLIKELLNANIISEDEFKKAELYLSLSTRTFDTHRDAIEWLIQNRAVGRDRQDQVKATFNKANLNAVKTNVPPAIEPTNPSPPANNIERKPELVVNGKPFFSDKPGANARQSINEKQAVTEPAGTQNSRTNAQSVSSLDTIYSYNLKQLNRLVNKNPKLDNVKQKTKDQLKNCPYLFCDLDDLDNWIKSDYKLPIDINERQDCLDFTSAMQLYSLVEKGFIAPDEYLECYYYLTENTEEGLIQLPFNDENILLDKLIKNGCLSHDITDRRTIKNYNHNRLLVNQLIERAELKSSQLGTIEKLLQAEPDNHFNSPQELLDWIKPRYFKAAVQPPTKKKRFPLFFILFIIYIIFRLVSGILKEDEKPVKRVASVPKQNVIQTLTKCSDPRILTILKRRANSDSTLKSLGELKTIGQQKTISGDSCSALATFDDGSADVTFRLVTDKNTAAISITDVKYSNLKQTKPVAADPVNDIVISAMSAEELDAIAPSAPVSMPEEPLRDVGQTNSQNDNVITQSISEPRNEYEAVILSNLAELDKLITERAPNSIKLLDTIVDVKLSGRCTYQSHNEVTMCPFTVYYKDVWMNTNTVRDYKLNVKFISENNGPKLQSQTEFLAKLTDEMVKNYQKANRR